MRGLFGVAARGAARAAGHPAAFCGAVLTVLLWAATGPYFGWSDTWQLVINTGTTIITFLIVFLLQASQNRDSVAVQLKLDEVIRSIASARDRMIALEDLPDAEFERLRAEMKRQGGG